MMYSPYVTMKDQKVYGHGGGTDLHSIDNEGRRVPLDPKLPILRIKYNHTGSLTHPEYREVDVKLADVWLIGASSFGNERRWYVDDYGVNHENARKAAMEKHTIEVVDWCGNTRYICIVSKAGYFPLEQVTGKTPDQIAERLSFHKAAAKDKVWDPSTLWWKDACCPDCGKPLARLLFMGVEPSGWVCDQCHRHYDDNLQPGAVVIG